MTTYDIAKRGARSALRTIGFDLVRTRNLRTADSRRAVMLRSHGVEAVLDVGANVGEYAAQLREVGFQGKILSFEPTNAAFRALTKRAANDPLWSVFNFALGAEGGVAEINVASNNGASSSIMPMLGTTTAIRPEVKYIASERIEVRTLDDAVTGLLSFDEALMLKIDTQGFEHLVLCGSAARLPQVRLIECELSFVPLYQGQLLFPEMLKLLDSLGFRPVQFAPGFSDPKSGYCLQVDGTFARKQVSTSTGDH